ncbi:hypothetical protein H0H87_001240 [Tephrocybe sp. NHM501043]|nr:hypothetical protein H0H87_001240 [Tephrocybe sp. NHM501043]
MRCSYSLLALLCVPAALGRAVEAEQHSQSSSHSKQDSNQHVNHSNGKKVATKIILTNDDGWAVAQIRSEYRALKEAGYEVVLSAPADNKSGTGSSTAVPVVLTQPCEFDSCPTGSPAVGFNASDPYLNYVNAFPVDSVRHGIQTLSPKLMGSKPDLVFAGNNIGNNIGWIVTLSGTVGAASEAALEGIPSVAFSGAGGAQVSYTTLESDPTGAPSVAAAIYTKLSLKFINQLLDNPGPILPTNISLNVNYPSTVNCTSADDFKFIFTRIYASTNATDVHTCGSTLLPDETTVVTSPGCFATVSVFNASTKDDVPASTQAFVHRKLQPILSCL